MIDRDRLLDAMRSAAREAGQLQVSEWRKRPSGFLESSESWAEEKAAKELVSFVDRESERIVASSLHDALPGSAFFGEEGEKSRGELTWVVDPLDGTTNYICGLDWFCVSIALFEAVPGGVDRPIAAAVYRPAAEEWFWAVRNGGAWEERPGSAPQRLEKTKPTLLRRSLVCTGTPYRSPETVSAFYSAASELTAASLDLRRLGSAALDLCSVAAGRLQAFWEIDLKPYDVGAALLLLEETGCPVSTVAGAVYDPFSSRSLVTGSPGAAEELRTLLARHYSGVPGMD
jgi:myo-inositol-1(or 4)-monophosphatase